jgi:SAM-dependent methyltransferase
MGQIKDFITSNHLKTKRDYHARSVNEKPVFATLAKKFDKDYWDGPREIGYGGYKDDGRWSGVAEKFLTFYNPSENASILDIGCGKGFLLNQLKIQRPDLKIKGVDVSAYALDNAPSSIRPFLEIGSAENVNFDKDSFDLVVSLNTLHNLELPDLVSALKKIENCSKGNSYLCVESYRSEQEKWNLMRWQLTCEAFYTPREWEWIFSLANYTGDYEFIFFE